MIEIVDLIQCLSEVHTCDRCHARTHPLSNIYSITMFAFEYQGHVFIVTSYMHK